MSAKASRGASEKRDTRSGRADAPSASEEDWRRLERQRREIERLREQVAERDQQLADRDQRIAEQQERISDAEKQISDAEKQIADLERQLASRKKNSTNSSKPPSSDGMAGAQRTRCSSRKKSGRKPGGQRGHTGHNRPPVENPDRIEEVLPEACTHCGTA